MSSIARNFSSRRRRSLQYSSVADTRASLFSLSGPGEGRDFSKNLLYFFDRSCFLSCFLFCFFCTSLAVHFTIFPCAVGSFSSSFFYVSLPPPFFPPLLIRLFFLICISVCGVVLWFEDGTWSGAIWRAPLVPPQ